MEKLGVEIDETKKEASTDAKRNCPNCGNPLPPPETSNVPCCSTCGTKPFEAP